MTADRLRQAAAKLREVVEAATAGPWETRLVHDGWTHPDDGLLVAPIGREYPIQPGGGEAEDYGMTVGDATYIATMHPPVALAFADLLDRESWRLSEFGRRSVNTGEVLDGLIRDEFEEALAVADAILGAAS